MENHIATTIEQSKKLIELGIDVNTADMYWWATSKRYYIEAMDDGDFNEAEGHIKAWSLSALLGMMPKLYEFENDPNDGGCQPNLCKGWNNNRWHVVYRSSIYITNWYDDPLDAAFEMVVWLLENGKIRNL